MSGLEVASGVIAVLSLSAKVAQLCAKYYQDVAHARTDIARVQSQLEGLQDLLKSDQISKITSSQQLQGSIDNCGSLLIELERKLKIGKGRKAMKRVGIRALSWPFTRQEVEKIIKDLESSRATLQFALQIDTAATVHKIDLNLDLSKLPSVKDAAFDSRRNQHEARCHPNTRIDLLADIRQWADNPHGRCIYWLCGMAGTGKSTVAYTVAQDFKSNEQLGATFFFKRGEGDRGSARKLFTTIASQLARSVPQLIPAIRTSIEAADDISEKAYKHQFEQLVLNPFKTLQLMAGPSRLVVIVIDALDECDNEDDIKTVLRLLAQAQTLDGLRFRIFVTSRPDLPVRLGFRDMAQEAHHDVHLHEIPKDIVDRDLLEYISDELTKIQQDRSLPVDWPGASNRQSLVQTASPLFIFAATMSRFIGDRKWDPEEQLRLVLEYSTKSQTTQLYKTYSPVFDRLLTGCNPKEEKILVREFCKIIGSIVIFEEPLTVVSMSKLIDIKPVTIDRRLESLHSVLDIPDTDRNDLPVRLLHLSFRDFLVNPQDQRPEEQNKFQFWVDQQQIHAALAKKCLELLSSPGVLKRDICDLRAPGTFFENIDNSLVQRCLPSEVQYACRHWISHLNQSGTDELYNQAYHFLRTKLLYWIEAMILIGRMLDVLANLDVLKNLVSDRKTECAVELVALLQDARRFVLAFRYVIETTPLQIYCSALLFAPEKSMIKLEFQHDIPDWILQSPKTQQTWTAVESILEGHSGPVVSVAFSPDGKRIASGSWDTTIRLWDAESGAPLTILEGHTREVEAVAFSPDSKRVVSGSHDTTVKLWDAESVATLRGHERSVSSVAFSPDGKRIASGSDDYTIKIWNAGSGTTLVTLEGHINEVCSVVFSPSCKRIASGSRDNTIKLWNVESGAKLATFEGHLRAINSVAFSPGGKRITSGSSDGTIRLWDAESESGKMLTMIENDAGFVKAVAFSPDGKYISSVSSYGIRVYNTESDLGTQLVAVEALNETVHSAAFSPDGKRIAIGFEDDTVRLWSVDSQSSTMLTTPEPHSDKVLSIAISPDGKRAASGSSDDAVKLWDTESGTVLMTLKGHRGGVNEVVFSPDSKLIASASYDKTVRLWDAQTGVMLQTLDIDKIVWNLSFSPDSKLIASASYDKTVRLWDAQTGVMLHTIGTDGGVSALFFSPGTKLIASASSDKTVRLWDAQTGVMLQTFETNYPVYELSFLADGTGLVTDQGVLRLNRRFKTVQGVTKEDLSKDRLWITLGSANLLRLPADQQGSCFDTQGQRIVFGHNSGRVTFLHFDFSKMDFSSREASTLESSHSESSSLLDYCESDD